MRGATSLFRCSAARIAERGRDELVGALSAADVPAGPVNTVSEALAAMEAAHDGAWTQSAEGMRLAPDPIRVDGERLPLRAAPPRLGDGTNEILREVGFSPERDRGAASGRRDRLRRLAPSARRSPAAQSHSRGVTPAAWMAAACSRPT